MLQKNKKYKSMQLFVIAAFTLLILSACANVRDKTSWQSAKAISTGEYKVSGSALTQFGSALRKIKQDPELLYQQACYLQDKRKHKIAISLLNDIIEINPAHVRAYNAKGVSHDQLREYSKAIVCYKRALKIDPDLGFIWNNMGYSHILQGHIDAAIEALKQAISIENKNSKYHNNLGLAYAKKGLYELAFTEFIAGGGKIRANYNMAKIYYQNGQHRKAEMCFTEALRIDPENKQTKKATQSTKTMTEVTHDEYYNKSNTTTGIKSYQVLFDDEGNKIISFDKKDDPKKLSTVKKNIYIATKNAYRTYLSSQYNTSETVSTSSYCAKNNSEPSPSKNPSVNLSKNSKENRHEGIQIEISNGNGVNRMAKRVGDYLTFKGYNVSRLTNAEHFGFQKTIVYYDRGYFREAHRIACQIPGYQKIQIAKSLKRDVTKVKVLIGKDLVIFDSLFH